MALVHSTEMFWYASGLPDAVFFFLKSRMRFCITKTKTKTTAMRNVRVRVMLLRMAHDKGPRAYRRAHGVP